MEPTCLLCKHVTALEKVGLRHMSRAPHSLFFSVLGSCHALSFHGGRHRPMTAAGSFRRCIPTRGGWYCTHLVSRLVLHLDARVRRQLTNVALDRLLNFRSKPHHQPVVRPILAAPPPSSHARMPVRSLLSCGSPFACGAEGGRRKAEGGRGLGERVNGWAYVFALRCVAQS
jgi:hypothetical protein